LLCSVIANPSILAGKFTPVGVCSIVSYNAALTQLLIIYE